MEADSENLMLTREERLGFIAPSRALFYGWLLYLLLFTIAPIRVVYPIALGPVLYILISCIMFLLGCSLYKLLPHRQNRITCRDLRRRPLFQLTLLIAIVGIALRSYDRFFVRGVSLAEDILLRKSSLEVQGSNVFSMLAAGFFPFCLIVPFVLFVQTHEGKRRLPRLLFSLIVFSLPGLMAILVGSRSIVLTSFLLILIYLFYSGVVRLRKRIILALGSASVLLLFLFASVLLARLEGMGLQPEASVYNSGYAASVQPNSWIAERIDRPGTLFTSNVYFTYLNLTQYAVHGLFEFSYLYQNFEGSHTWGADTFTMIYKCAEFVFRLPPSEDRVLDAEPNPGVFTTFFGPIYIDFGWFGPMLALGFGLGAQAAWMRVKDGDIALAPFYFYVVIVIFLAPIVNMLSNGEGIFILASFAMFYFVARMAFGRRRLA